MALTLTELLTEVSSAHGNRTDISEARQIVALNLSQIRIARMHDWNELWEVDSGTIGQAVPVPATDKFENTPANIRKIYSFRTVDTASKTKSKKLIWVPQRQWDEFVPESEAWSVNQPTNYTIWKRSGQFVFELWPIPDEEYNYEIRSNKWPTDFSAASPSASSELENKDDMLIALATSWLFLTVREMEEANRWWTVYKEMLSNATGQEMEEHEIDIRAPLEQSIRGSYPVVEPWKSPFNRTGVE